MKTLWQNLHEQSKGMLFAHGYLSASTALAITRNENPTEMGAPPATRIERKNPHRMSIADLRILHPR